MRTKRVWGIAAAIGLVLHGGLPVRAETPTAIPTPEAPTAVPSAIATSAGHASAASSPAAQTSATRTAPSASPTPARQRAAADTSAGTGETAVGTTTTEAPEPPAATAALGQPRVFRTPERAAPPAFVAPDAGSAGGDGGAAPAAPAGNMGARPSAPRAQSGLVVFRMTARTALEGFELRVSYPPDMGSFGSSSQQPDCNAGTGVMVVANDRGTGEIRLEVVSLPAIPFPLDLFCRFTLAGGASLDPSAFGPRVTEVTSDGKRADPSLLLVAVAVR